MKPRAFDPKTFLGGVKTGKSSREYRRRERIFAQGDAADAVFYVQTGKVQLKVLSARGEEVVVSTLDRGSFFGEGSLAGQPRRISTACALQPSVIVRVEKRIMVRLLRRAPELAKPFTASLLSRNIRAEKDLVEELFNSSERRLARVLLLLVHFGKASKRQTVVPKMSQDALASMVGTTRSEVGSFMKRFRKMGFIDGNADGDGLRVHSGLLSVALRG
jgi:CRP/FNR family transcriptional regulator, cyclic AMP receptor protein